MNEAGLRQSFESEMPALAAWGRLVADTIVGETGRLLAGDKSLDHFFKIWPIAPRVKDVRSFVAKALRRGKRYKDPLKDITDKVGVRFVVLLLPEIRLVEKAVTGVTLWKAEMARDFLEERREKPHHFDYQSLHYVVRAAASVMAGGVEVPEGTACEIQIRTLLQHAYSELSHDVVYKPKSTLDDDTEVSRQVARSMALIETSDMIFEQVNSAIEAAWTLLRDVLAEAAVIYRELIGIEPIALERRLVDFVLSPFRGSLRLIRAGEIRVAIEARPYMASYIRANIPHSLLCASPLILIVVALAEHDEDELWRKWPLEPALLEDVYSQLGISADRY